MQVTPHPIDSGFTLNTVVLQHCGTLYNRGGNHGYKPWSLHLSVTIYKTTYRCIASPCVAPWHAAHRAARRLSPHRMSCHSTLLLIVSSSLLCVVSPWCCHVSCHRGAGGCHIAVVLWCVVSLQLRRHLLCRYMLRPIMSLSSLSSFVKE